MAVALIVAAGRGERLGTAIPKAFVTLAGLPMLEWSLRALAALDAVESAVIALPPDPADESVPIALPDGLVLPDWARVVVGGAARSMSVRNALAAAGEDELVLVHDAARPLVGSDLFGRVLAALAKADAAVAASPVADTIKQGSASNRVLRTLDRSGLWAVQTPQGFKRATLEAALDQDDGVLRAATDEASLVERAGGVVRLVDAPEPNFKVTTPADLMLAELLLGRRV